MTSSSPPSSQASPTAKVKTLIEKSLELEGIYKLVALGRRLNFCHQKRSLIQISQLCSLSLSALPLLSELDQDLSRSVRLWAPLGARGVFGGQVVAQALVAAIKTVPSNFVVNSLHSYFVLPGDSSIPIMYRVYRIRDGKSFCTRTVNARQHGKVMFTCTVSFQVPEASSIDFQTPMPKVPPPEEIPTYDESIKEWLKDPQFPKKFHKLIQLRLQEPFPILFKPVNPQRPQDLVFPKKMDIPKQYVWMKANGTLPDDFACHACVSFKNCFCNGISFLLLFTLCQLFKVAAYCSDHYLLNTSLLPHGITSFSNPGLKMIASLDHTIWFHGSFRADEWLLFEMEVKTK